MLCHHRREMYQSVERRDDVSIQVFEDQLSLGLNRSAKAPGQAVHIDRWDIQQAAHLGRWVHFKHPLTPSVPLFLPGHAPGVSSSRTSTATGDDPPAPTSVWCSGGSVWRALAHQNSFRPQSLDFFIIVRHTIQKKKTPNPALAFTSVSLSIQRRPIAIMHNV